MLPIERLSIDDVEVLLAGARAKVVDMGVPTCIAISYESGNLIAFTGINGAKTTSMNIANDTSFTAAGIRHGTDALATVSRPGQLANGIVPTTGERTVTIADGRPVLVDGDIVESNAVSTGTPAQDLEVAGAGLQKFVKQANINHLVRSVL